MGWRAALAADPHLAAGLNVCAGSVTHPAVASALGYDLLPNSEAIGA
jgi:alanine dehydrogenase